MSKLRPEYDEQTGRLTILVDNSGVHLGENEADAKRVARDKSLINQLYDAMGWKPFRNSVDMRIEITRIEYAIDFTPGSDTNLVHVHYRWRDTGEEGVLDDPAAEFPSPTLRAALAMIAGPLSHLRQMHRERVAKWEKKEKRDARFSSRPW